MGSAKAITNSFMIIIAILLITKLANATQPSLPTALYGKVSYSNNNAAEGINVEATWKDSSGTTRTSRTKTFNLEEATASGNPSYKGYYFFTQGSIMAQEGSDILINAEGSVNTEKITATPGKDAVSVPMLVLRGANDKNPPEITSVQSMQLGKETVISLSTNEPAISIVRYGPTAPETSVENKTFATNHKIAITGLLPATYSFEVIATDSSGNIATDSNNGSYYRFTSSPVQTPETPKKTEQNIIQTKKDEHGNGPPLPTSIYGQLEDEKGKPVANIEVQATWTDEQGNTHTQKTETLDSEEATKLGNPDLEGYYFFRENISLPLGTEVNITSPEIKGYSATAQANPGGSSQANAKKQIFTGPEIEIYLAAAIILVLIGLLTVSARHYYNTTNKSPEESKFSKDLRKLLEKKVKDFMAKEAITIQATSTIGEAARLMSDKQKGGIIVAEGITPIGWVNERIITEDALLNGMQLSDEIRTSSLLKPVVLKPNTTLYEAYKHMEYSGQKKAIIISEKKMTGIITITDLAEQLRQFYDTHFKDLQGLPDVTLAIRKNIVRVKKNSTLKEIRQAMSTNKSDCAIVDRESPGDEESILTERDIIKEIMINPKKASTTKAAIIAKSPIKTISWYSDLLEANKAMLKEGFRRLPVKNQDSVVGIVTMEDVVKNLISYLETILPRK
ncbi:CBS domain-containing protein [Candidatus Woesearchaeota archaeon]|nr:CBS domain-containing protein [Candidatus Woesearchaeota archaeon]